MTYAPRRRANLGNPSAAGFDAIGRPQTRYALEALQQVFARMPWDSVVEFSDGRRGRITPFYEPRWTKGATGSTELVQGGFDLKFLDGAHLEFIVEQSGWETPVRRSNPQAKLEHRDLLTGAQVRPGTWGSIPTGRYVMRIRPAPGEPFEVVEVDPGDLDPAKDSFGVDRDTVARYRGLADAQAGQRARDLKRLPTFERDTEPRIPGSRATFSSAPEGVETFLSHNPSLWNLDWADVGDQIEDWMDRTEVRRRSKYRPLDETARGREILDDFRRGANDRGFTDLLAYLFGQAKGRRWDEVPWPKVESLVGLFADAAHRESDRMGSTDFLSAGVPSISWMPPATGFHSRDPEYLEQLDTRGREYYRRYAASQNLFTLAATLRRLLREHGKCLSKESRSVVRARAKTLDEWAHRPDEMPEWACAVDQEPGVLCGLLGIEEEARKLSEACERPYDPDWPAKELSEPLQPGMGVIPGLAARAPAQVEDLDLPWENAGHPAVLRERLKRR